MKSGTNKMKAPGARLKGISRSRGSKGGCKMRIEGDNFSEDSELELINEDKEVLCDKMTYVDIHTMECTTIARSFSRRRCRLRRRYRDPDEPDVECERQDCDYETGDDVTPVVTSCSDLVHEGNRQVFNIIGTGFTDDKGLPEVRVGRKEAVEVTLVSETLIKVEF